MEWTRSFNLFVVGKGILLLRPSSLFLILLTLGILPDYDLRTHWVNVRLIITEHVRKMWSHLLLDTSTISDVYPM